MQILIPRGGPDNLRRACPTGPVLRGKAAGIRLADWGCSIRRRRLEWRAAGCLLSTQLASKLGYPGVRLRGAIKGCDEHWWASHQWHPGSGSSEGIGLAIRGRLRMFAAVRVEPDEPILNAHSMQAGCDVHDIGLVRSGFGRGDRRLERVGAAEHDRLAVGGAAGVVVVADFVGYRRDANRRTFP